MGTLAPQPKLLDRVRLACRVRHFSPRTERAYHDWAEKFIRFHGIRHGPIRRYWWNRRWVPVTWDGGGDHLCLDFDPAPGGVSGQVICFSHEIGPVSVVADSWEAYLEQVATDLETGRLLFGTDTEFGNSELRLNPAEPAAAPDPAA